MNCVQSASIGPVDKKVTYEQLHLQTLMCLAYGICIKKLCREHRISLSDYDTLCWVRLPDPTENVEPGFLFPPIRM